MSELPKTKIVHIPEKNLQNKNAVKAQIIFNDFFILYQKHCRSLVVQIQ